MHGVAQHWQQVDPLLPTEGADPDGERLDVDGGYGIALTQRANLGLLSSLWTDDLQHVLIPRVTTPDAMDSLLATWLRGLPASARGLTKVTWPSRDTAMAAPLLRHGFQASGALAVRRAGLGVVSEPPPTVRGIRPEDVDEVTRLWLEMLAWDAQFGNLLDRPAAPQLIRAAVRDLCCPTDAASVVAEQDEQVVAAMLVHPAPDAAWAQDMTSATPAAYLAVGLTTSAARGQGVGAALAHAAAERADHDHGATLLNYNMINPLSGAFWHRMGYRPLWYGWRRRHPAT